jgi:xylulokinase
MKNSLLGLDVGTTSTKAVLFDLTGNEIARAASPPYHTHTPNPGWVEQDPEEIWQAVLGALRSVMERAGPDIRTVAMGIAAQSGSLLPAAADGVPVYPLITWMDGRTEELVRTWREKGVQQQVKPLSGWSLYAGLCLPTIAWLRRYDQETFSAARHFFSVNDFIVHRLTGKFCTNPSNGGGMQLVDIHSGRWSEALCALAGINCDQLSPIEDSGTIIGEILPNIIDATGLTKGVVLVNGGHDQGCTALGLGVNAPGKLLLACGTAWVVTGVVNAPDLSQIPDGLDMNFHPAPDLWTISQSLGGLGASLEWWVNQVMRSTDELGARSVSYAALSRELDKPRSGGSGLFFLPLTGGHDDPATTKPGGFVGLQLSHNRGDMSWAVLECAAFELRWALEAIQRAGLPVERLWMVGGAAQSSHWPAVLANVTAVPINLPQYDYWPALGAAVLAGVGIKAFDSVESGLERFRKSEIEVMPDKQLKARYDDLFDVYQRLRA